jgi:hypothetical protein
MEKSWTTGASGRLARQRTTRGAEPIYLSFIEIPEMAPAQKLLPGSDRKTFKRSAGSICTRRSSAPAKFASADSAQTHRAHKLAI